MSVDFSLAGSIADHFSLAVCQNKAPPLPEMEVTSRPQFAASKLLKPDEVLLRRRTETIRGQVISMRVEV